MLYEKSLSERGTIPKNLEFLNYVDQNRRNLKKHIDALIEISDKIAEILELFE